jgi:glyoxylase-like metal-dependent hydrolase (beta-lactamase superfamily II)
MSDYSIWVLEYCAVPTLPKGVTVHGAFNAGTIKLPYCYVVIKGGGKIAMVDIGFANKDYGAKLATAFGVQNWHAPAEVMKECGVRPEDVTDIFITHAHFDHIGDTDSFPNAKFYMQERELSKWVWAMALDKKFSWFMGATDPNDIIRCVDLARQGRLVCLDGDKKDVLPGIDVYAAHDTHTWGSMFVSVKGGGSESNKWVFSGDLIYSYTNLTGHDPANPQYIPIGLASGSQTNILFSIDDMMKVVGGEVKRILPIHDENLPKMFPSRITKAGLSICEIQLAKGEKSAVN